MKGTPLPPTVLSMLDSLLCASYPNKCPHFATCNSPVIASPLARLDMNAVYRAAHLAGGLAGLCRRNPILAHSFG